MVEEFGSSEAGKKGGKARADALTSEERKQIARNAALKRWDSNVPQATHEGTFEIGDIALAAAVLSNKKRLITQATFLRSLGRSRSPKAGTGVYATVDGIPFFLQAEALKPFISEDLMMSTTPVFYRALSGKRVVGYDATLLPAVAEVYLKFRDDLHSQGKAVPAKYAHIVGACDILMRGLARVGIVALVDEATGHERDKERNELVELLRAYVVKELQGWLATFDLEFYELICDIRHEPLERAKARPSYMGGITNNLVYQRLAPGVLQMLREVNPVVDGRRKHKHHQHLTRDLGHPKLKEHLAGVTTAMKIAKAQKLDWDGFLKLLDSTHPKHKELPLFDHLDEQESGKQ